MTASAVTMVEALLVSVVLTPNELYRDKICKDSVFYTESITGFLGLDSAIVLKSPWGNILNEIGYSPFILTF